MPFYNHLGLTLTKLSPGSAEMEVKVTKELTQAAGFAHGGVAASLIDSAVGLALCTTLQHQDWITTVELKVNFLAPAKLGLLKAKGGIVHRGKRIAVGSGEVRDKRGKLVATGLVTYMILESRRNRELAKR
jgi:acyl-CoA thioesterase